MWSSFSSSDLLWRSPRLCVNYAAGLGSSSALCCQEKLQLEISHSAWSVNCWCPRIKVLERPRRKWKIWFGIRWWIWSNLEPVIETDPIQTGSVAVRFWSGPGPAGSRTCCVQVQVQSVGCAWCKQGLNSSSSAFLTSAFPSCGRVWVVVVILVLRILKVWWVKRGARFRSAFNSLNSWIFLLWRSLASVWARCYWKCVLLETSFQPIKSELLIRTEAGATWASVRPQVGWNQSFVSLSLERSCGAQAVWEDSGSAQDKNGKWSKRWPRVIFRTRPLAALIRQEFHLFFHKTMIWIRW